MGYCSNHSIDYSGDTCSRCDAEERHRELLNATEENLAQTVGAMRESDYRRANPGEYACPHCQYISLKSGASRCPLCHGEVGRRYWDDVRAEYERAAPQREAARRATEEAATSAEKRRVAAARKAKADDRRESFVAAYFAYWLPVLSYGTTLLAALLTDNHGGAPIEFSWVMLVALIPLVNWLMCLLALFDAANRGTFFVGFAGWAIAGGIGYLISKYASSR